MRIRMTDERERPLKRVMDAMDERTKAGGSVVSNHRKKSPAVSEAKSTAGSGDAVVVHRQDGTVQNRVSY